MVPLCGCPAEYSSAIKILNKVINLLKEKKNWLFLIHNRKVHKLVLILRRVDGLCKTCLLHWASGTSTAESDSTLSFTPRRLGSVLYTAESDSIMSFTSRGYRLNSVLPTAESVSLSTVSFTPRRFGSVLYTAESNSPSHLQYIKLR